MQQDPCISNVHESIQCWPGPAKLDNLSCTWFHDPELSQSMQGQVKDDAAIRATVLSKNMAHYITPHKLATPNY